MLKNIAIALLGAIILFLGQCAYDKFTANSSKTHEDGQDLTLPTFPEESHQEPVEVQIEQCEPSKPQIVYKEKIVYKDRIVEVPKPIPVYQECKPCTQPVAQKPQYEVNGEPGCEVNWETGEIKAHTNKASGLSVHCQVDFQNKKKNVKYYQARPLRRVLD